jgi:hypothetical protein
MNINFPINFQDDSIKENFKKLKESIELYSTKGIPMITEMLDFD